MTLGVRENSAAREPQITGFNETLCRISGDSLFNSLISRITRNNSRSGFKLCLASWSGTSFNPCDVIISPWSWTCVTTVTLKPAFFAANAKGSRWEQKYQSSVTKNNIVGVFSIVISRVRYCSGVFHNSRPPRLESSKIKRKFPWGEVDESGFRVSSGLAARSLG